MLLRISSQCTPVLVAPNFNVPFKLFVDACDIGVGGVLLQEDPQGIDHPMCYYSKNLDSTSIISLLVKRDFGSVVVSCFGGA